MSSRRIRLIPFIVSTEAAYALEFGHLYVRPIASGGIAGDVLASPYTEDQLWALRFTQSADTLFLAGAGPPRTLRRLTSGGFEFALYEPRNGPFRSLNPDESIKVWADAPTGSVTLTASKPIFLPGHVGGLFYLEAKELRDTHPWEAGERGVAVGIGRRSDGKVYRCTAVPSLVGLSGTPYYLCGATRPSHDEGRAYDGPQDTRTDGSNQYKVGVEWEYVHSGFGIVEIHDVTSPTVAQGQVTMRLPDSCCGGLGAVGSTWQYAGTGAQKAFPLTGNNSLTATDYEVTLDGVALAPNPFRSIKWSVR